MNEENSEENDPKTKKAHREVSLFVDLYGAGTRRTFSCCKGREFAGLEFSGFWGVPQRVTVNKSASYSV